MAFEKAREAIKSPEVGKMLDRLEARVDRQKGDKTEAEKAVTKVAEGIVRAKAILDKDFDFSKKSAKEIADLSNAWVAWEANGVFKGGADSALRGELQQLISSGEGGASASMKRFSRQVWRTEMVAYIMSKLSAVDRVDKADVSEKVMASQIVGEKENDPMEVLTGAMWLDPALRERSVRLALAEKMTKSQVSCGFGEVGKSFEGFNVAEIKVVVGGEFLKIPLALAQKYEFKNMVKDGDRIYAQMKNGCRGNLVIITPSPEPPPPPPPPPEPEKHTRPLPDSAEQDSHMYSTQRSPAGRGATVEHAQYDERISRDFASKILKENYDKNAVNGLLDGLDRIPPAMRGAALGDFLAEIGRQDPSKAQQAMQELVRVIGEQNDTYKTVLLNTFDAKINAAATPDEKKLWEAQKTLFQFSLNQIDPDKAQAELRNVYQTLKHQINAGTLSPELKEMYEGTLNGLETNLRQTMALDMVATSLNTAEGTFTERQNKSNIEDSLEELMAKSPAELKAGFANEGLNFVDSDAEVYVASNHVLEALRLLITYQYPQDIQTQKIINPVEHYYSILKSKQGNVQINLPAGINATAKNPLKSGVDFNFSGTIDLAQMFVSPTDEFRLFEEYQSGKESLGETGIWHWSGANDAFGERGGGLIELSKKIFGDADHLVDLMNDNAGGGLNDVGKIGATERLSLAKIADLTDQKHYDEARALCIEVLKLKMPVPTPAEIQQKADEFEQKQGAKIRANVRLQLEGQGITQANFASAGLLKPDGTPYASLSDYINAKTSDMLQEKAILDIYGKTTDGMDVNGSALSQYEKAALKFMHNMNGTEAGTLWLSVESREWAEQISKMIVEIVVVEVATAGAGTLLAGAGVVGEGAAMGSRTLAVSRAFSLQRYAVRGAERLRNWVAGTRVAEAVGNLPGAARVGRGIEYTARGLGEGRNWAWRGGRQILHAGTFVEGMAALHGDWVDPTTAEGAYQIGMMAGTFWALGKFQQILRGQTISAQKVAAEAAGGAHPVLGASNRLERLLARPVEWIGRNFAGRMDTLAAHGVLGYAGASIAEIVPEIAAFKYSTDLEEWLGVQAHELTGGAVGISETQRQAMQETETWQAWGNAAATALALRQWRARPEPPKEPKKRPIEVINTGTFGPDKHEPPPPPPPPPESGPRLLGTSKPEHDVDLISKLISETRNSQYDRLPSGEIKIGDKTVNIDEGLKLQAGRELRGQYEDALKMPENTPELRDAKHKEIERLDRLLASRLIVENGGIVEFPNRTQAEQARDGFLRDHPEKGATIYERDGKAFLYVWESNVKMTGGPLRKAPVETVDRTPIPKKAEPANESKAEKPKDEEEAKEPDFSNSHNVDWIAKFISENRHDAGVPEGTVKIGTSDVSVDTVLNKKVGDKVLREQYESALKIGDEPARAKRLSELDRLLASRSILESGGTVEFPTLEQALEAKKGVKADYPDWELAIKAEEDGRAFLTRVQAGVDVKKN